MKTIENHDINNMIIQNGEIRYRLNELLTVRMVMEVFGVTRVTVYNWLGKKDDNDKYPNGKLPHAFKVGSDGGKIYIPLNDVKALVDKRTKDFPTI